MAPTAAVVALGSDVTTSVAAEYAASGLSGNLDPFSIFGPHLLALAWYLPG